MVARARVLGRRGRRRCRTGPLREILLALPPLMPVLGPPTAASAQAHAGIAALLGGAPASVGSAPDAVTASLGGCTRVYNLLCQLADKSPESLRVVVELSGLGLGLACFAALIMVLESSSAARLVQVDPTLETAMQDYVCAGGEFGVGCQVVMAAVGALWAQAFPPLKLPECGAPGSSLWESLGLALWGYVCAGCESGLVSPDTAWVIWALSTLVGPELGLALWGMLGSALWAGVYYWGASSGGNPLPGVLDWALATPTPPSLVAVLAWVQSVWASPDLAAALCGLSPLWGCGLQPHAAAALAWATPDLDGLLFMFVLTGRLTLDAAAIEAADLRLASARVWGLFLSEASTDEGLAFLQGCLDAGLAAQVAPAYSICYLGLQLTQLALGLACLALATLGAAPVSLVWGLLCDLWCSPLEGLVSVSSTGSAWAALSLVLQGLSWLAPLGGQLGGFPLSAGLTWLLLCVKVSALFLLIVLIRVTVPRFKLETLSRLGWQVLLALLAALLLTFAAAYLWG